jgi:hypothetical protein
MDLREERYKDVRWIELAQDRVLWWGLLLAVLNLRVLLSDDYLVTVPHGFGKIIGNIFSLILHDKFVQKGPNQRK